MFGAYSFGDDATNLHYMANDRQVNRLPPGPPRVKHDQMNIVALWQSCGLTARAILILTFFLTPLCFTLIYKNTYICDYNLFT